MLMVGMKTSVLLASELGVTERQFTSRGNIITREDP